MKKGRYLFLKIVFVMIPIPLILLTARIDVAFISSIFRHPWRWWSLVFLMIVLCTTMSLYPLIKTIVYSFSLLRKIEDRENDMYVSLFKKIGKSTLYFGIVLSSSLPFVYMFVEVDDSPGFLLLYIVLAAFGYVFSALAYVLSDLCSENNMKI